MRVLVIEDEEGIREVLRQYLLADGHEVLEAGDGPSGLARFQSTRPDFVILDLMLPGMDGYELCAAIRRLRPMVPLIMLTARDHESDKVAGLRLGADDYVTKPFSPRELMARIAAVFRRARSAGAGDVAGGPDTDPGPEVVAGPAAGGGQGSAPADTPGGTPADGLADGLLVDIQTWQAHYFGEELALTKSELLLVAALAGRPMRVFTRPELLERIRGDDGEVTERAVDVHVANLRRKLDTAVTEAGGSAINPIETVWGLGYRWRKEATASVRR